MSTSYLVKELAKLIDARLIGDDAVEITGVATIQSAHTGDLCFVTEKKYLDELMTTKASAVILSPTLAELSDFPVQLICDNPQLAFAQVARNFEYHPSVGKGVASSAEISSTAIIAKSAAIGEGVVIGDAVQIGANCVIEDYAQIGNGTQLKAGVFVGHHCQIGEDCILHPNAIIGADGFGNAHDGKSWHKVPQLGRTIIGDNVEIGANSTIDRGALDDTRIHSGVRIDNLVMIAHNVEVGENTAIAAQSGIAGSTIIGKNCMIAGQAGINGHISICDNVMLTGQAMVTRSITEPGAYSSGTGLFENSAWRRLVVNLRRKMVKT